MLSNERYCGDAILQKSVTVDCIEKTIEMAALMYEQSNAKLNLTVSLARKLAQTMVTQDEFNRDYFTACLLYTSRCV